DGRESLLVPALRIVGENVTITNNGAVTVIDLSSLTSAGNDVAIEGHGAVTAIDLSSLTSAGNDVAIENNEAATVIDLSSLTSAGNDVTIKSNTASTSIDLSSLTTVGAAIDVSHNTSSTTIDLSSLTTVGDAVDVSHNTSSTTIDLSSLTTVGGAVDVSHNTTSTTIDLSSLTTVFGDLVVSNNGDATIVTVGLAAVTGDFVLETTGTGLLDLSGTTVGGDSHLAVTGYDAITASTAEANTTVTLVNGAASMTAFLPDGAFSAGVDFQVSRLEPALLAPEFGMDANNEGVVVDPLIAYEFAFGVPTLGQPADLTFTIDLLALDAAQRADLLDALAGGQATLAVKGDGPDAVYQAFALCSAGAPAAVDECVAVTLLDADGNLLAEGSTAESAAVRFEGIVGHFSTYAVAIINHIPELGPLSVHASRVPEGGEFTLEATFTDADAGDTHTVTIDWGDGQTTHAAVQPVEGGFHLAGTHAYAAGGRYTVHVTVTDERDGTATAETTALVIGVGVQGQTLYVIGTDGDDLVQINLQDDGSFQVHASFLPDRGGFRTVDSAGVTQIIVLLGDGNDVATVARNVTTDVLIDGEGGHDRIAGGGGSNILQGGPGNDTLVGGSGRDLLVGGTGADRIVGNAGDDILIAGSLVFADLDAALFAIMAEWTSDRDYLTRIANLTGQGSGERANGSIFLIAADDPATIEDERTVVDDDDVDVLTGSAGSDWFFFDQNLDRATDLKDEVFANDLEWILS
ncbi:MAG TPA: PKD domain-containing protein, partial [Planctomycetaceae bacterium]|nr:PKD domain-containing protein [Planctomycetaceae bacterium]